jgi:hypothetical protein
MHHYDVASKILMETCRDELIWYFAGIEVEESTLIEELPQETVSLKRSDFPVMVKAKSGEKKLALFELQTHWNEAVPLSLLDHRTRYQIKYQMDPVSFVILLKRAEAATHIYENNEVRFTFQLIKIYEMDARDIVYEGLLCLTPFVPLMKNGPELLTAADDLIYQSSRSRIEKADLLTSMAILSGIVSENLPVQLINRRKDIMIESAAYDIIKQDGIEEGRILTAREMLIEAIEARFGKVPNDIFERVEKMSNQKRLKFFLKTAVTCEDINILRENLKGDQ